MEKNSNPDVQTNSAYTTTTDENGNVVTVLNTCHHTPEFMMQEGIDGLINGERAALEAAAAAAAQAAAEAAGVDPNAAPAPEAAIPNPADIVESIIDAVTPDVSAGN